MKTQKVKAIGPGSLFIYLPKKWCEENGISDRDSISIFEGPGTLTITSDKTSEFNTFFLDLSNLEEDPSKSKAEFLKQVIIGAYVNGFERIVISYIPQKSIPGTLQNEILEWSNKRLEGIKILDISDTHIDFAFPPLPSSSIIYRTINIMYQLTKKMVTDVVIAIQAHDKELLCSETGVKERDNSVDRFNFLLHRFTNQKLIFPTDEEGITPAMVMQDYLVSRNLEKIADHAVKMSKSAKLIIESDSQIDSDTLTDIISFNAQILKHFDAAVKSYLMVSEALMTPKKISYATISEALKSSRVIFDEQDGIYKRRMDLIKKMRTNQNGVPITLIFESHIKIFDLSKDIALLTINKSVYPQQRGTREAQNIPQGIEK
jgi:phosphate uptake regulator